jgi:hypothetical protein
MARNAQTVKHSARTNLRAVNGANYLVWGGQDLNIWESNMKGEAPQHSTRDTAFVLTVVNV